MNNPEETQPEVSNHNNVRVAKKLILNPQHQKMVIDTSKTLCMYVNYYVTPALQ